jgi:glutathione S-transferase
MPKLTLISHDLCPYVQRAVIALAEKGVAFDRIYVDLAAKPDWFKAMSPLGKVPLLKVGEDVIFESAVILEYLEETQSSPLYPTDALVRAKHRAMVEFGSAMLSDIWGVEIAPTRAALDGKVAALREKFVRLETMLAHDPEKWTPVLGKDHAPDNANDGPWFAGSAFGIVDAVFAPVFRYFESFDAIFAHGILDGLPKVARWRTALAGRPSVRNAVAADYRARLDRFIMKQNGALAAFMQGRAASAA